VNRTFNFKRYFIFLFLMLLFLQNGTIDGFCCDDPFSQKNRKIASAALNVASGIVGSIADYDIMVGNIDSSNNLKIANACTSGLAGLLKIINWRKDDYKSQDGATGKTSFLHQSINTLVIGCNASSAVLSILSSSTHDVQQKHIYNFVSFLTNVGGIFLKGVELWFTQSPYDNRYAE
jgi:hypothetical protein